MFGLPLPAATAAFPLAAAPALAEGTSAPSFPTIDRAADPGATTKGRSRPGTIAHDFECHVGIRGRQPRRPARSKARQSRSLGRRRWRSGAPLTARAHIGHSTGHKSLGPNATNAAPTGDDRDWSLDAKATWRALTLDVSCIDTDGTAAAMLPAAFRPPSFDRISPMDDLLWIAIMTGLLAATLAYARLCDDA